MGLEVGLEVGTSEPNIYTVATPAQTCIARTWRGSYGEGCSQKARSCEKEGRINACSSGRLSPLA